jgi:transitional endoplasmic reticulum ATPase
MKIRIPFLKREPEKKNIREHAKLNKESEFSNKIKRASELKLKAGELTDSKEFGKGIVRLNLDELGIREGDIVEIEGKRKTGAIAFHSYPDDKSLNLIRMDRITRRNINSNIGEYVKVRKCEIKDAKKVVLAPAEKGIVVHISPELIKKNIYMRTVTKGDIIVPSPVVSGKKPKDESLFKDFFGYDLEEYFFTPFLGETKFIVISTEPPGIVRVTTETNLEIIPELSEVVPITEEDLPHERIINVKTIPNIQKMMELKNLDEIGKLAKSYYINKYEDKKQVIYFIDNWYFKKVKNKLKKKNLGK